MIRTLVSVHILNAKLRVRHIRAFVLLHHKFRDDRDEIPIRNTIMIGADVASISGRVIAKNTIDARNQGVYGIIQGIGIAFRRSRPSIHRK